MQYQVAIELFSPCFVGVVDVADTFHLSAPGIQVVGVLVLLGAGADELAPGPLGVGLGLAVEFCREPGYLLVGAGDQLGCIDAPGLLFSLLLCCEILEINRKRGRSHTL